MQKGTTRVPGRPSHSLGCAASDLSQNTQLIIVIGRSADIGGDSDQQPWPFTEFMEGFLYVHTLRLRV